MAFQASGFSINIWAVSACIWCYCSFMPSSATRFPLSPTAIATSLVLPMAYGLFNSECCTYVILCVRFLTDINANEFRVQMKFISSNWYLIQWWLFTLPLLLINFIPIKWWKIKTTSPRLTPTDFFPPVIICCSFSLWMWFVPHSFFRINIHDTRNQLRDLPINSLIAPEFASVHEQNYRFYNKSELSDITHKKFGTWWK